MNSINLQKNGLVRDRVSLKIKKCEFSGGGELLFSLGEQCVQSVANKACIRQLDQNLRSDQRDTRSDNVLIVKSIHYQRWRVANDWRLWAYSEYAVQRRTQRYRVQAFRSDC
mgnify:CR=1 FL=1|jgi:hypothetical protein